MTSIQPISADQEQKVIERTATLIRTAAIDLETVIPPIEVRFDLTGRAAGMYCSRKGQRWIRYNPYLFAKYFADNFACTIPHEVAHYLVDATYNCARLRPHGQEWQNMMILLNCPPETTHKFNLSGIPVKRQQRHPYRCSCGEHLLSSTRHNRVQRNRRLSYYCRHCNKALIYTG